MTNAPDETRQRVREYLVGQAAKRDWHELWPRVLRARVELLEAIDDVSPQQAAWAPDPDAWSIEQVMRHALGSSRETLRLIEALARGDASERQTAPGAQPEDVPQDWAALRRAFVDHSGEFASLLGRLPPTPNLELTARHAFFGELNSRAWFLFQRVHDMDHSGQIGQNKAAPGYPGA